MKISAKEIEIATEGKLVFGDCAQIALSVSTDSRADCNKALFVPLSGPNYDGRRFIGQAFEKGATIALTDRDADPGADEWRRHKGKALIRVDDALAALGKLAAWHRHRFAPLVIGITGSVGKTTAKEMISLVLGKKYAVHKTRGNFNNEIGLPLSIFGLTEEHTALVLEMGMSGPGEIMRLSKIARPDMVVITNIGQAHIERFGTKQSILKAKLEIMEGLSKNGTVFMNGDDTLLHGLMGLLDRQIVYYGIDENLDVVATDIILKGERGFEFEFRWRQRGYRASVGAVGAHNVYNALAAVAVGLYSGVKPERVVEALAEYRPDRMRMGVADIGGAKLINDAYNANPQSVQAALDALAGMETGPGGKRIAVLGDMLELGEIAEQCHRGIGAYAASKRIDAVVSVGRYAGLVKEGAEGRLGAEPRGAGLHGTGLQGEGLHGAAGGCAKPGDAAGRYGEGLHGAEPLGAARDGAEPHGDGLHGAAGGCAKPGDAAGRHGEGLRGAVPLGAARDGAAGAEISGSPARPRLAGGGTACEAFADKGEAEKYVLRIVGRGDIVLVKGSRATAMESIADGIAAKLAPPELPEQPAASRKLPATPPELSAALPEASSELPAASPGLSAASPEMAPKLSAASPEASPELPAASPGLSAALPEASSELPAASPEASRELPATPPEPQGAAGMEDNA